MSDNLDLTSAIQSFAQWSCTWPHSIDTGLRIIADAVDVTCASLALLSNDTTEISYSNCSSHKIKIPLIDDAYITQLTKKSLARGGSQISIQKHETSGWYFISLGAEMLNSDRQYCLYLWSQQKPDLSDTEKTFLMMAVTQIALQKNREIRHSKINRLVDEALDVVEDSIVLYDENQRIIAFNNKHLEIFPSVADTLVVGADYETVLRAQADSGPITIPKNDTEAWVKKRKSQLETHGYTEEQKFVTGRTLRLTNYQMQSGGTVSIRSDITELVEARQQAVDSENLFRTLLESAPVPLIITSNRKFVFANEMAHRLLQHPTNNVIGEDTLQFYAKISEREDLLDLMHKNGRVDEFRLAIKAGDGQEKIVSLTGTKIVFEGKEAMFYSLLDITETIRNRESRERSERQNRALLDFIPDALIVQVDGVIKFVNDAAVEMFKAGSKENLIGTSSIKLVPENEYPAMYALREQTIANHKAVREDSTHLRHDSSLFQSENHSQSVTWNGEDGIMNIVKDISSRYEFEQRLKQSEREMSLAQEIGNFGHWRVSLPEKQLYWSPALYNIYGLAPNDPSINLDRAQDFILDGYREKLNDTINDVINHKSILPYEIKLQRNDGHIRSMMGSILPEYGDNGRVIGVFGVSQDVTEQRELEAKLRQSQKMEAVGQLTGGIAHDFNNLLAVILGNSELLQEMLEEGDSIDTERLNAIIRASRKGADLTRSMLAFSRTQQLVPIVTDLRNPTQSMVNVLERTIPENIDIAFQSDNEAWQCIADVGQVENAILNLSLNARDAMPAGGNLEIEIRNITVAKDSPLQEDDFRPGDYIRLSVIDNGGGIPKDELSHVFEPFYTTKDVGKGTGLGLSMVYGFIKQSQGHVLIRSKVGRGTRVCMYLPRINSN
jgi:PAS domain S-box-containing protein